VTARTEEQLRDDLLAAIGEWDDALAHGLDATTPLFSSGRLDSLNVFRILLWVEAELGQPVDATKLDIAAEWDTVDRIVSYVRGSSRR
jgi:acyl carrier protein